MSLWDKWEQEKRRKEGLEPEAVVEVRDTYHKPNVPKQILIVVAAVVFFILLLLTSVIIESAYTGRRWSDSAVIRLLIDRQHQREEMSRK